MRLLFFLFFVSTAWAQVSAVRSGTVTDQSGAVISGANVTAKNVEIGASRSSQQTTVSGDAPVVGVTNADVSGLVGERQIKDLPLNGLSYDELLTLNPGVVNFTWGKPAEWAYRIPLQEITSRYRAIARSRIYSC